MQLAICGCQRCFRYAITFEVMKYRRSGNFSSLKIFRRWPTTTKIRRTKIFQHQSDKVRIALLGYMKPVRGLPDHRRLFFFSHMTNSIQVCLPPCVAYTHLWLSRKFNFRLLNFRRVIFSLLSTPTKIKHPKKFLQTKISRSTVCKLPHSELLCVS